jgi:hypothetical protein
VSLLIDYKFRNGQLLTDNNRAKWNKE